MFSPMVSISDNMYPKPTSGHPKLTRGGGGKRFDSAFSSPAQLPTPVGSVTSCVVDEGEEDELRLSDYIDIPLLVSDNEEEDSDGENSHTSKPAGFTRAINAQPPTVTVEEVKRSIKEETQDEVVEETSLAAVQKEILSSAQFNTERMKLMKIVVKYVAMKITNSFPPASPRTVDPNEMPLDTFLMILTSRLQLSMSVFMKGIIYLFRYMDIIYLLRYLNQSNNFANYTDMGFGLRRLIIGCFKLTLARDRQTKDWSGITGLSTSEINTIVKTVVTRLNGKLMIKNIELVRLKLEIFRFVKMVTKTV